MAKTPSFKEILSASRVVQSYRLSQIQTGLTNVVGELEFNLGTANIVQNGSGVFAVIDDSANSRTKVLALTKCLISIGVSGLSEINSRSMAIAVNDVLTVRGSYGDAATTNVQIGVSDKFYLDVGEYLTFGVCQSPEANGFVAGLLVNAAYFAKLNITGEAL